MNNDISKLNKNQIIKVICLAVTGGAVWMIVQKGSWFFIDLQNHFLETLIALISGIFIPILVAGSFSYFLSKHLKISLYKTLLVSISIVIVMMIIGTINGINFDKEKERNSSTDSSQVIIEKRNKESAERAKTLKKECERDNFESCSDLGFMYYEGDGVLKDSKKAVELFTKACDRGNASGCSNLGLMYKNGDGVRQDKFKAVELFTKACDVGIANGCSNLGTMYSTGEGVRQDKSKAVELFTKACGKCCGVQ